MKTDLIYANLIIKMTEYFKGDTRRIQHFLKVYSFAETIALLEQLDAYSLHILKTAAIVHDIGIKISEEKYGDSSGKHQELEGIAPAHKMLQKRLSVSVGSFHIIIPMKISFISITEY